MARRRIALIGCGFIGRYHAAAIRNLIRLGAVDAELVVLCDLDEGRARSLAAQSVGAAVSTDAADAISRPDVDIVYVCVPTAQHKDLVVRAAAEGKDIFCEKPLAAALSDVEEMAGAVGRAGVRAGVGLVLRHSPILNVLKSLTEDATLGRLMAIVFRDDQFFPVQGHCDSEWRKDRRIAGAGTLLERSIHDVDVMRWLAGEVHSVRGSTRNFADFEGIEDLAVASLRFQSEALAELVSIWHSVLGRASTRHIELFYENGVFIVDDDFLGPIQCQVHAMNARTMTAGEVRERYLELTGLDPRLLADGLRYSLEDYFLLRALSEERDPFPGFEAAAEAHRVIDAVYRSAAAGGAEVPVSGGG